jgi:hypothetical protein
MPDIPSCQNVSVSFGGVALGNLIGFDEGYSAASPTDTTGATATIVGTGGNTRVIRQVEITMIEPGSISFRCWGNPPFGRADIGLAATLAFTVGGVVTSWTAQLASVQRVGSAGELIQGSYQFQFMG